MNTVQKRIWEENDKCIFDISDEINGDLFLLEEAESVRRNLCHWDRPNCDYTIATTPAVEKCKKWFWTA